MLAVQNVGSSQNFRNLLIVLSHLLEHVSLTRSRFPSLHSLSMHVPYAFVCKRQVPRDLGHVSRSRASPTASRGGYSPSAPGLRAARHRERERRQHLAVHTPVSSAAASATAPSLNLDSKSEFVGIQIDPPTPSVAAASASASVSALSASSTAEAADAGAGGMVDQVSLNPEGTGPSDWLLNLLFVTRHVMAHVMSGCGGKVNREDVKRLWSYIEAQAQAEADGGAAAAEAAAAAAESGDAAGDEKDGKVQEMSAGGVSAVEVSTVSASQTAHSSEPSESSGKHTLSYDLQMQECCIHPSNPLPFFVSCLSVNAHTPPSPTPSTSAAPAFSLLTRFVSALCDTLIDVELNATTLPLHVEVVSCLLVLCGTQLYSPLYEEEEAQQQAAEDGDGKHQHTAEADGAEWHPFLKRMMHSAGRRRKFRICVCVVV